MADERHDQQVIQAWNAQRPYLVDLAFRMLGDIGAAEDVVQDAFSRLMRARPGEIEDERGWLIVVTSRLCLDQIRSAGHAGNGRMMPARSSSCLQAPRPSVPKRRLTRPTGSPWTTASG